MGGTGILHRSGRAVPDRRPSEPRPALTALRLCVFCSRRRRHGVADRSAAHTDNVRRAARRPCHASCCWISGAASEVRSGRLRGSCLAPDITPAAA